jgi:hypothetical protein
MLLDFCLFKDTSESTAFNIIGQLVVSDGDDAFFFRVFKLYMASSLSCYAPSVIFKHFHYILYFHTNSFSYYNSYSIFFQLARGNGKRKWDSRETYRNVPIIKKPEGIERESGLINQTPTMDFSAKIVDSSKRVLFFLILGTNILQYRENQQKRIKKTNFSDVPTLFSRLGGILGWGCHPLL